VCPVREAWLVDLSGGLRFNSPSYDRVVLMLYDSPSFTAFFLLMTGPPGEGAVNREHTSTPVALRQLLSFVGSGSL
jgi:hypothetical protein